MHVQLEHSELLSFAETVLREIDVDRHLEVFKESLLFRFKDRRGLDSSATCALFRGL